MNGQPRMNHPPYSNQQPQNPNQAGTHLGAVGPYAMTERPQWVVQRPVGEQPRYTGGFEHTSPEQQRLHEIGGAPTEQIRAIGTAGVGGHVERSEPAEVIVGMHNPTRGNYFKVRTQRGTDRQGRPLYAYREPTPAEIDEAAIRAQHAEERTAAAARLESDRLAAVKIAELKAADAARASTQTPAQQPATPGPVTPQQGFGPKPTPVVEQRPAETAQDERSRREANRPAPRYEDEDYAEVDWRTGLNAEDRAAADTADQVAALLAEREAIEPAPEIAEPAKPETKSAPNTRVGGAIADRVASQITAGEEGMPQGIAAVGDDIVRQGAEADINFAGPRPNRNAAHEAVPNFDGFNGGVIGGGDGQ